MKYKLIALSLLLGSLEHGLLWAGEIHSEISVEEQLAEAARSAGLVDPMAPRVGQRRLTSAIDAQMRRVGASEWSTRKFIARMENLPPEAREIGAVRLRWVLDSDVWPEEAAGYRREYIDTHLMPIMKGELPGRSDASGVSHEKLAFAHLVAATDTVAAKRLDMLTDDDTWEEGHCEEGFETILEPLLVQYRQSDLAYSKISASLRPQLVKSSDAGGVSADSSNSTANAEGWNRDFRQAIDGMREHERVAAQDRLVFYQQLEIWSDPISRQQYFESHIVPVIDGKPPGRSKLTSVSHRSLAVAHAAATRCSDVSAALAFVEDPDIWEEGHCEEGYDAVIPPLVRACGQRTPSLGALLDKIENK